jgi:hypothetical protein
MFDYVGDIDFASFDPGLLEGPVEQLAGRTDEWMTFDIFAVTRLFANHHYLSTRTALAQNRLRSSLPYVASAALLGRFPQITE